MEYNYTIVDVYAFAMNWDFASVFILPMIPHNTPKKYRAYKICSGMLIEWSKLKLF
jgi:hypothetical protein